MANNLPILSDKVPDLGDRAPTPEEIIGWLKEQAFSMGRIGFSTVFQPHRTAELMQADLDLKQDISPTYRVPTPASTLGFCVGQWEREQYISKKLLQNQRVVKEAGAILDKRLLAAGMSQQDLAKFKKVSPLQKVVELYKIENPPPKGPERVMVKILRKTDKGTQLQEAYLPVEDTLDDLKPALNRLSAYMDGRGEYVLNQAHGPWVYQLVERSSSQKRKTPSKGKSAGHKKPQAAVEHPRKYLSVDADWKELANFLRKEGNKAPIVVLCQVRGVVCTYTAHAETD